MKNCYDLIVIGGGTSGCAAAFIAAKLGLKVLILEKKSHLGGTITSSLVTPVMKSGQNQINTEFYSTLVSELSKINAQLTYMGNSGWFNPELLKILLDKLMTDAGVDVVFNSEILKVNCTGNIINNLQINLGYNLTTNKTLSSHIGARYFLDSTGDCNFAKKINCEFLQNPKEIQPMTLRFIMSGVNCEKFATWILEFDKDREVTTVEKFNNQIHFSTAYTWDTNKKWALAPLFEKAVNCGDLLDVDRNYFQIFTVAGTSGSVTFNCPRIIENFNPENILDKSKALILARCAIYRLANFCKKYLPGFENAFISNIADEIGVRVSNRIKGKYIYCIEDLKSGKTFKNPVLISSYPVDVHNRHKNNSTLEFNKDYQLPIESLMSADYDNLFVAGRCISADYLSQGALRVQSSCFSMGEAIAKYIYETLQ